MKNSNKTTVLTMVVSLLVAFVLVMSGPTGSMMINSSYVYAAKSSGGGSSNRGGGGGGSSGGGSHSSKGGSSGGGSDKGGSSGGGGGGSDSGGDKAGSNGGGDSGKDFSDSGGSDSKSGDSSNDGVGTISSGTPKDDGNIVGGSTDVGGGGGTTGITHNPNDDGFTDKDGPQNPIIKHGPVICSLGPCGKGDGKDFFCRTHPGVCHRHHDGDNVKVIHRTVVVHDRNNTPQTILLNTNTQTGTCFVSSQEVVNVPDLVTQLLNQCSSVTITP
jgi:hypothetical protein